MLMPLYGFLEGDSMGLLILAHDTDTVADVAAKLQRAAHVRQPACEAWEMYHAGRKLEPEWTMKAAGLSALERIDVVRREP